MRKAKLFLVLILGVPIAGVLVLRRSKVRTMEEYSPAAPTRKAVCGYREKTAFQFELELPKRFAEGFRILFYQSNNCPECDAPGYP